MKIKIYITIFIFLNISCAHYYVKITKAKYTQFNADKIKYDSCFRTMTVPYDSNELRLHYSIKKSYTRSYFKSIKRLTDTVFECCNTKKCIEKENYNKENSVKFGSILHTDGWIDRENCEYSFLDSSIIDIDSVNRANGMLYLKIKKQGETILKASLPDTFYFIHFVVDTSTVEISNTKILKNKFKTTLPLMFYL